MVDTFQIATQGIGPGWSTFGFATQGFGFEVEVIVRPATNIPGGSGPGLWQDIQPYEIIVRIKYKGQVWEERRTISALMAKSLEKVLASFRRIYHFPIRVKVSEIAFSIKNVIVNVISKNDKYNK